MIFTLDDYCVVDGNKCQPGQIYCSQDCKQLDQIPSLIEDNSDSLLSTSYNSIDDHSIHTPKCTHQFMYDSKFTALKNCNCNERQQDKEELLEFVDIDVGLNSPYCLKNTTITPKDPSILDVLKYETHSFEKLLEENKHIKNSFKTAKDNYRLWLSVHK